MEKIKFHFSAYLGSPSERSIFHLLARRAGGEADFDNGKVTATYVGSTEDHAFRDLLKLFESQPGCTITLSTK